MVTARTARNLFSVCVASRPWSVWTSVCTGARWWQAARGRQLHGVGAIWDSRRQASAGWGSRHHSTSAGWGSKKHAAKRKILLQTAQLMMDAEMEKQLAPLRASCKEQVRHCCGIYFAVHHSLVRNLIKCRFHGP